MSGVWLVCLGAAVGAPARYLLDRRVSRGRTTSFPTGTFTINLLGSLLLGLLLGVHDGGAASPVGADLVLLLGTGFCGAFTTYSAFAVEVVALARAGLTRVAVAYAVLSPLAALACATLAYLAGRACY